MKQFTLPLYGNIQRPVANLPMWYGFDAMIDTGALFPVWVSGERVLVDLGATCIKKGIKFGGFGGDAYGNLYRVPYFQIGELIYPGLPIIAHTLDLPCHLLLSASMFSHLRYEVDDENHRFNVIIPDSQSHIRNLTIYDEEGHIRVLCVSGSEDVIHLS